MKLLEDLTIGEIASTIGVLVVICGFIDYICKKWNQALDTKLKDMIKRQDDMQKDINMLSDVCYQMLDHMATENNTGGMKRALDDYNKYNRHN